MVRKTPAHQVFITAAHSFVMIRLKHIRSVVGLFGNARTGQQGSGHFMNRLIRISKQELSSSHKKIICLVFFCVLTVAAPILFDGQGVFVSDEGIYALMARSFAESGSLAIWNGYEEFPSPAFALPQTLIHEGRLVSQYPYLTAVLSYPFYRLAGFAGLFILNAIAYVATVGVCFLTARALFRDMALALNACLILVFATYSWEYSQAVWPHALSMLFVATSVYLAVAALMSPGPRASLALALAGGAVAGFGAGIRLDVIFVLPALVVPFIFVRPWRPWCALAACLGTVPGLAVLAATNYAKFGVFSAFAYSPNVSGGAIDPRSYLTIVLIGLAFLAAAWFISRHRSSVNARLGRWFLLAGLVALTGIVLFVPALQSLVFRMADGVYQLLVDLRIRDLDYVHGGLSRGPGGGMVYINTVKKALLQSCPYLIILVVPIAMLLRGAKHSFSISVLLLAPAAFVAAYGYFAWAGGTSLNQRYFVPILPFTSILAAFALREVTSGLGDSWRRPAVILAGVTVALYAVTVIIGPAFLWGPLTIAQKELVFLTLPLAIAASTLVLVLARWIKPGAIPRAALAAVLAVGLVWSGLVAFTHDFSYSYAHRRDQGTKSRALARVIEQDSLVITMWAHYFYAFPATHRVRIALPHFNDFKSFDRLVEFHLDQDRAVYLWLNEPMKEEDRQRHLLDDFAVVPIHEVEWSRLVRLRRLPEQHRTEAPADGPLSDPDRGAATAPGPAP